MWSPECSSLCNDLTPLLVVSGGIQGHVYSSDRTLAGVKLDATMVRRTASMWGLWHRHCCWNTHTKSFVMLINHSRFFFLRKKKAWLIIGCNKAAWVNKVVTPAFQNSRPAEMWLRYCCCCCCVLFCDSVVVVVLLSKITLLRTAIK